MTIDPEDQVAADIAAAEARGEDPFADKPAAPAEATAEPAPAEAPAAPAAAPAAEVAAPEVPKAPEAPAVAEEPKVEPVKADPINPPPTTFQTSIPADYKAQRSALVTEKAALMQKLMEGELDAEGFAAEESRISDALEDLTAQRIRAETLQEANVQTQAAFQQREIQKLIASTKTEVDYATDTKAQRQFDMALQAVGQDPDNAGKDYAELLNQAHTVVMALRGVMRKEPEPAKAERPTRTAPQPPQTLAGLPTAASSGAKSVERTLAELTGDDLERAFDSLGKAELQRLLKS